ncbi:MAG: peptidoglycan DD-metalloendopeptidase family protein [Planctomycetota bacterium]|nr:peptidoglycan DD-metalloendopeptidase family protein [Planctomycetota bacterium]
MSLADDYVRTIFEDLLAKRDVDANTNLLASFGEEAVPVLLEQLASGDFARQKVALFGLQYCYAPEMRTPVEALITGSDNRLRELGAIVLSKHYGMAEIQRIARKLEDHPDPEVAGFAMQHLEAQDPDPERAKKALRDPRVSDWLWKYLPRYGTPDFSPGTRALLERRLEPGREAPHIACGAIAALIAQNDRSPETRARLRGLLGHEHPQIREMAAEYLAWHGGDEGLAALREALNDEPDRHARASMEGAVAAIGRRTSEADDDAFERFAHAEEAEPFWNFRGRAPDAAFERGREARLEVQARAFAIPGRIPEGRQIHAGPFKAPVAAGLVAPVRDYLDEGRTSFALVSDSLNTGFRGMVHVGDDVGWFRDFGVVVACADGQVRQAGCASSWGHLAVIEHRTRGGDGFCSVYGHLSPFLTVRPGEVVRAGQRIGSIGRSFAWENGGYAAHLHFGLHHGPYVQLYKPGQPIDVRFEGYLYVGRVLHSDPENTEVEIQTWYGRRKVSTPTSWVRGYVSMRQWTSARHRWLDPQEILRENA